MKALFSVRYAVFAFALVVTSSAMTIATLQMRGALGADDPWATCPLGDDEFVASLSKQELDRAATYFKMGKDEAQAERMKAWESIGADFGKLRRGPAGFDEMSAPGEIPDLVKRADVVAIAEFEAIEFHPNGSAGTFRIVESMKGPSKEGDRIVVALNVFLKYSPYYPVPGCGLVLQDREFFPVENVGDRILLMAEKSNEFFAEVASLQSLPLRGTYGIEGDHVPAKWLQVDGAPMLVSEFLQQVRQAARAAP